MYKKTVTSASCHVLDDDLKFLRFQFVMNKRVANALPNLHLSHSLAVPCIIHAFYSYRHGIYLQKYKK